jgi:hypothetical protein
MPSLLRPAAYQEPEDYGAVRYAVAMVLVGAFLAAGAWWVWSSSEPELLCLGDDELLIEGVSCEEAAAAIRYGELLAARHLQRAPRAKILADLRDHTLVAPEEVHAHLASAAQVVARIGQLSGLLAAQARSQEAWAVVSGDGVFPGEIYPTASLVMTREIAAWTRNDEHQLVLTEMDVEGWIQYASLCREVQGGGPVVLSMASRVSIYRELKVRFDALDRDGQLAMVAVGPFWTSVQLRWSAATYSKQQAWIDASPLPPPMKATSLAYISAIVEGDVQRHVGVLHEILGPLEMDIAR